MIATDSSALESSAVRFKQSVLEQIAQCQRAAENMRERIEVHDLHGAQQAWLAARSGWEWSGVIGATDARLDAERTFRTIGEMLFAARDVGTLPAAEALVADLVDFERQLRASTLTAQELMNGTARRAYEVGRRRGEGGESPRGGDTLTELRDDLTSIAAAYKRVFAPAIKKIDPGLATIFSLDLDEIRGLAAVHNLIELDRERLGRLSEWLAGDLVLMSQEIGLEKPPLATQ